MFRLQELFKTVADISLLQEKLTDAQVELAEKSRLPVTLEQYHRKVDEARRQLSEARQKLLKMILELSDRDDREADSLIITGRGGA